MNKSFRDSNEPGDRHFIMLQAGMDYGKWPYGKCGYGSTALIIVSDKRLWRDVI